MRFLTPIALALFALAVQASPEAEADALRVLERKAELGLDKRACTSNGCACNSRGRQLLVCGGCVWSDNGAIIITKKRNNQWIYECNPSGGCCTYGYASDCGKPGERCKFD